MEKTINFEDFFNKQTPEFIGHVNRILNRLHKKVDMQYKSKIRLKRLRYKYFIKRMER